MTTRTPVPAGIRVPARFEDPRFIIFPQHVSLEHLFTCAQARHFPPCPGYSGSCFSHYQPQKVALVVSIVVVVVVAVLIVVMVE